MRYVYPMAGEEWERGVGVIVKRSIEKNYRRRSSTSRAGTDRGDTRFILPCPSEPGPSFPLHATNLFSAWVHVQVGKHRVGHGCEIDAGGLQSLGPQPGPRQVRELAAYPSVDEYGPAAATHHDRVQRPFGHLRPQGH